MTRDVDFHEDGTLRDVTRIEFNLLDAGLVQWQLWSDDVLLETHVGQDFEKYLRCTRFFLSDGNEKTNCENPTEIGDEDSEAPGRLG